MAPSRKHGKSFVCEKCGKKFSGDRSRHNKLHSEDKDALKWTCASCGFGDLQKHNVLQHYVRVHTADRPYECSFASMDDRGTLVWCPFKCQTSSILTKHKIEEHDYSPKKGKSENVSRPGILQEYEQFVIPPPSYFEPHKKPSTSSLPAVRIPAIISFPVPPPPPTSSYTALDASFQTHPAQALHAAPNCPCIPKMEPVETDLLLEPYMVPSNFNASRQRPRHACHQHQSTTPSQLSPSPMVPVPGGQRWGPYRGPPVGHSARHW